MTNGRVSTVERRLFKQTAARALTLAVALSAVPGNAGAQQSTREALTHLLHVVNGFAAAPGGRGLAVAAASEVNVAMMHANFAAGHVHDLQTMKDNARRVVHSVTPQDRTRGPGVKRSVELVAAHIDMAVAAPGASEAVRRLGPNVAIAARAVAARAQTLSELGARVLAAASVADAAPLVQQLSAMALELDTGRDANGNGRIDIDGTEPGLNQVEAHLYAILEAEKLPRVLK